MTTEFERPISPIEWMYLSTQESTPPLAIQLCVEGQGILTRQLLQEAVNRAAQYCPGASAKPHKKFWKGTKEPPIVREVNLNSSTDASLPLSFEEFCKHPVCRTPLTHACAEVILWHGAKSRVLFRVAHAAMDAQGCVQWAKQVFACLRNENPASFTDTRTDWDVFRELGGKETNHTSFSSASPFSSQPISAAEIAFHRITLPPQQTAVIAKISSALARNFDKRSLRMMIPVDLRRHYPALLSTANLSLPIFLDVTKYESWVDIQSKLLLAMQNRRELANYSLPSIRLIPKTLLRAILRTSGIGCRLFRKFLSSALISHVGKIDLEAFRCNGFTPLTVYSLPVHTPFIPLSIIIVESEQHTEITVSAAIQDGHTSDFENAIDVIKCEFIANIPNTEIAGPPSLVSNHFARHNDNGLWACIAKHALHSPQSPAIACSGTEISYKDMLLSCENIAAKLHKNGVRKGDRVAVLVERNSASVLLALATIRVGAAFVPIDAAQPVARATKIIHESGAKVCLVPSCDLKENFSNPTNFKLLNLEDLSLGCQFSAPNNIETSSDIVYLMYTSGSTGVPKGVPISQKNILSYLLWASETYGVNSQTRFALITSMAFDLAITAWLLPLFCGGCVEVMHEQPSSFSLQSFLDETKVNSLKIAPAHLELISGLPIRRGNEFKLVVVGGAQLLTHHAERAQALFGPQCRIFNEYGPTEATVGCVVHQFCSGGHTSTVGAVPIGRPIAGTQIVLQKIPPPESELFEMLICGDGVFCGYDSSSVSSEDSLVQLENGQIAYRTGDLARKLANGELEYCGRLGDSFKINGYRVDKNEVTDALRANPQVTAAHIVVSASDSCGSAKLLAYVVLRSHQTVSELRNALLKHLPPYMVPHRFLRVQNIPLNSNGKVDESALLQQPFMSLGESANHENLSPNESNVAKIWASVLECDQASLARTSHFFDLGGDSLAFLKMLTLLEQLVNKSANKHLLYAEIKTIVANPTIEQLVGLIARINKENENAPHCD